MNKAKKYLKTVRSKYNPYSGWYEIDIDIHTVAKELVNLTLEDVKESTDSILELVNNQAEDEGIFFQAKTAPEAYLQQEIRKLHQITEDKLTELEKLKL